MTAPTGGTLTGVASLEAILRHARHVPVFPCRRHDQEIIVDGVPHTRKSKSPLTTRGFQDASQDEGTIRGWWKRWPDALVGTPTGTTTNLVVIDWDPGKHTEATAEWLESHTDLLLAARVHTTNRGGRHYLYRLPKGQFFQSGADLELGEVKRPGLDLRCEGGYVIWWPLHGGQVTNDTAPFLPAGLIDERSINAQRGAPLPRSTPSPQAWIRDRPIVADALSYLEPAGRDAWIQQGMAIHLACGGNDDGFELWHEWSAGSLTGETPKSYQGIDDCRAAWASFRHTGPRTYTLGTLFFEAQKYGFTQRRQEAAPAPDAEPPPANESPAPAAAAEDDNYRRPMDWADLATKTPPVRTWRISHWLTAGPTLLAGSGGIGKTLLAQTVATALALGKRFLDDVHEPTTVLFWACEDDHDELWRRQAAICKFFGVGMAELAGKLIIEPRLGCENTLFTTLYGSPAWTPLREELASQVGDYKASVLFLDNIGQIYGAKENERHQVTMFLNGLVGVGSSAGFTPIIMGHPSKSAGSEFSGSSAWENAVRMRWFMGTALPDQQEPEEGEADPNIRYLSKRKTNYTVKDYRKLCYRDGVFVPEESGGGEFTQRYGYPARCEATDAAVLFALSRFAETGIRTSDARTSPDYLPKKMRESKLAADYTRKELAESVVRLRLAARISEGVIGKFENRTAKRGLVCVN